MLSAVISSVLSYGTAAGATTGPPVVRPSRSSRTRDSLNSSTRIADRDRTVSRRSEPSSRTTLIGEQPKLWDLLQPQDVMSRHRGAKHCRRYELLGSISLLSPAYLLSVERWPFHSEPPITMTVFDSARLVSLTVRQATLHSTNDFWPFWAYLRTPPLLEATAPVKLPTIQCLDTG